MGDRRRRRAPRVAVLGTVVAVVAAGVISPAQAATTDLSTAVASWDTAAARLGTAGSLWEPRHTDGLRRAGRITLRANAITVADGVATGGRTFAQARYGRGGRTLTIRQKWAETGWAARPDAPRTRTLVRTVRVSVGPRGMRTLVPAKVYATCPQGPCTRADVQRFGGTIELTARPASTMTAPGATSVVISSTGVSYATLVRVASGLEQVAGAPAGGAGSAQMVGMCRQMVTGHMTPAQAEQFAMANGYVLRVGSIDGQAQPGTADYRPDRFTVTVVADAVTACSYG